MTRSNSVLDYFGSFSNKSSVCPPPVDLDSELDINVYNERQKYGLTYRGLDWSPSWAFVNFSAMLVDVLADFASTLGKHPLNLEFVQAR